MCVIIIPSMFVDGINMMLLIMLVDTQEDLIGGAW
jgi:hypothetical protein